MVQPAKGEEEWTVLLKRIEGHGSKSVSGPEAIRAETTREQCIADLAALRDQLELLPPSAQADFTSRLLPWAIEQLQSKIPISFKVASFEYRMRAAILSVLRLVPSFVDALRPFVDLLMPVLLSVIEHDADLVAADAMQLFTDMNKAFRAAVEAFVPPFLDFILGLATDFEGIKAARIKSALWQESNPDSETTAPPSKESFRLLHDAPVMIVLVFQLHRRFINEYIPRFVPVVVRLLQIDAERPSNILSPLQTLSEIENEPASPMRVAFGDYISAQVKASSTAPF